MILCSGLVYVCWLVRYKIDTLQGLLVLGD